MFGRDSKKTKTGKKDNIVWRRGKGPRERQKAVKKTEHKKSIPLQENVAYFLLSLKVNERNKGGNWKPEKRERKRDIKPGKKEVG